MMGSFFQAYLCEINTACTQRTVNHHCCRFPFYYKKVKYTSCTRHGDVNNRFWCATDHKYNKNSTGWGYCKLTELQCFVKTTDGICCILPFKYRGIEYKNCVATEGKSPRMHWCATKVDFDKADNGSGWGYCAGTTCFTCQSSDSWEHCNRNAAKKTCLYGVEHCSKSSGEKRSISLSNITKIFKKDCARQTDCSNPSRFCNEHNNVADKCWYECCHGDLCNVGRNSKENANRSLALLFAVVMGIKFIDI